MQYLISRVLAEAETMPEATIQILRVLCESLEYDFAQAWSFDHGSAEFIAAETWHVPSENYAQVCRVKPQAARLRRGTGVPGVRLGERQCSVDSRCGARGGILGLRTDVCKRACGASSRFQSVWGTEVLGVIELFSPEAREPDDDLRTIITNIGKPDRPIHGAKTGGRTKGTPDARAAAHIGFGFRRHLWPGFERMYHVHESLGRADVPVQRRGD